MTIRIPIGLCLWFATTASATASQIMNVDDGKTYSINVSAHELTRIAIEHGRIDKVRGLSNHWIVQPDKENGELYITPKEGGTTAFSFFVKDSYGNTYTFVALPRDIPSETVLLQPTRRVPKVIQSDRIDQPYIVLIKGFMRDMARVNDDNYLVMSFNKEIPLWKEVKVTLRKEYEQNDLMGDVYVLQNISDKPLVMDESEFSGFGEKVEAIAVEKGTLEVNETTLLYVVRQK